MLSSQWLEAMKQIDKVIEQYPDGTFLIVSGMDAAIVGVEYSTLRLVYDVEKIIGVLMKDMSREDALEYFEYNILDAYVGELTPIFINFI